jgi:hypothetical protein
LDGKGCSLPNQVWGREHWQWIVTVAVAPLIFKVLK